MFKDKVQRKKRTKTQIRKRIRKKIWGTEERPRVYVFKSNKYIYIQAIDDDNGVILSSLSTLDNKFREKNKNTKNIDASKILGEMFTKKLKEKKIKSIVFDRGIYPYHGRIKTLADEMRKGGLVF